MFTHPPSSISLYSMATRFSQRLISPYSSRSKKKEPHKCTASSTSPRKIPMYPTRQAQLDHMAQPAAKSQQAGTRRPHHQPYLQQNTDRTHPGGSRALPTPPRKDHYQDWLRRDEDQLMKSLHRKPKQRMPLQSVEPNIDHCPAPRGPRRRQATKQKASAIPQPQARMSEMYSLIDDYIIWNESSSDLDLARPGSSGTMFVDFASNGEMEVSYRNGVHKKLPTPPVPSKIPTPPTRTSTHRKSNVSQNNTIQVQSEESTLPKQLPPRPSYGTRHDSVISSGAEHEEHVDPYQPPSRPLPPLPSQNPRVAQPQSRKSYPPQVHRTQRSASQPRTVHRSPRTPSRASDSSSQTASTSPNGEAYTVIEPTGLAIHFHPSFTGSKSASHGFVNGHDQATNYEYDYNGRTMHIHRSPTTSCPESWTSEYFEIPASTYNASTFDASAYNVSPHPVPNPLYRASSKATTVNSVNKPLPPLPRSNGYTKLPETPRAEYKKRTKVLKFVQKLLHKLDDLGVMKDLSHRCRHHSAPV